jgi:hypothetical protein
MGQIRKRGKFSEIGSAREVAEEWRKPVVGKGGFVETEA